MGAQGVETIIVLMHEGGAQSGPNAWQVNGCNNFSGSYTVKGDSITIGPLMSTMMACPDPAGSFESQFLAALQKSTKWSVSAGTLDLRDDSGAQQVAAQTAIK